MFVSRVSRRSLLFSTATLLAAAAAPVVASPVTINSFESVSEINAIQLANATAVQNTSWATQGSSSVALTFAAGGWAQALFNLPAAQDMSGRGGMAFDFQNTSSVPVTIAIEIDDNASVSSTSDSISGRITIPANSFATAVVPFAAPPSGAAYGMKCVPPLAPGGRMLSTWGTMNLSHVVDYRFYTLGLTSNASVLLDNVRAVDPYTSATFTGIVDKYGQPTATTAASTPVTSDSDFAVRNSAEQAWLAQNPAPADRDSYGGWANGPSLTPTGYFTTTQYNGKWWLVTPTGHLFFSAGIDSVIPTEPTMTQGRESMFQSLPASTDPLAANYGTVSWTPESPSGTSTTYDFYGANLQRKYGASPVSAWAATTTQRLKSWGFNTIGWSDPTWLSQLHTPYTMMLSTYGTYNKVSTGGDVWGPIADPYDPAFVSTFTNNVSWQITSSIKNDPLCMGYFVDNELSWCNWQNSRYSLPWGVLQQTASSSPAKTAFISRLQTEYGTIGALNSAWGTSFASWSAANSPWTVQASPTSAAQADLSSLALAFARQYFTTIRGIVKAQDPNHLYLGCRFGTTTTPEATQAASESCDVVSFNVYGSSLAAQANTFAALNKPVLIGEFHFGAVDTGMFGPGLVDGFNQSGRASMYSNYISSALTIPSVVGCHWFEYADEPVAGRSFDGENFNIGFVDVTDTPYWPLVNAARTTNSSIYSVRGN